MSDLSTLTLHLPRATTDKLERLAGQRHTTPDALVGQALADFADRELAIVASIERGLAEIDAGLGLETDDVFRDVEADARRLIDDAAALLGKTRTEFMVETARRHAIDVLLDRRLFRLDPDGYDAFLHALDNPPAPGPKLRALMRRAPAWRT